MVLDAYEALLEAEDFHPDTHQKQAVEALHQVSMQLAEARQKSGVMKLLGRRKSADENQGLYIWGSVGRGKTMLMDLFCNSLPQNVPWRRLHFHEFMREVHDFLHEQRQKDDSGSNKARRSRMIKYAERVRGEADVLCFDEFHVTDIGDAMLLGNLFSALLEKGVTVIATSNWPPERLYEGGLQRDQFLPFIDLIKTNMHVFNLAGDLDYRSQTLQQSGTYFTPLGQIAYQKADDLFMALTDGAQATPDIVDVKSRKIEVGQAVSGIARFTFAELCERPRAANDYLAIADRYHTVFIEKIPKLGYDRRNEVKRFMTLIDTLYDKHINVVITAAAAPEALYTGQDYEFEFERTISRLQEMQGKAYIETQKS